MSEVVKGRRPYDASSRQQQARASRRHVLATATRMFLERGYSDTTVPAVARAAGVSPQNVSGPLGTSLGS